MMTLLTIFLFSSPFLLLGGIWLFVNGPYAAKKTQEAIDSIPGKVDAFKDKLPSMPSMPIEIHIKIGGEAKPKPKKEKPVRTQQYF